MKNILFLVSSWLLKVALLVTVIVFGGCLDPDLVSESGGLSFSLLHSPAPPPVAAHSDTVRIVADFDGVIDSVVNRQCDPFKSGKGQIDDLRKEGSGAAAFPRDR